MDFFQLHTLKVEITGLQEVMVSLKAMSSSSTGICSVSPTTTANSSEQHPFLQLIQAYQETGHCPTGLHELQAQAEWMGGKALMGGDKVRLTAIQLYSFDNECPIFANRLWMV